MAVLHAINTQIAISVNIETQKLKGMTFIQANITLSRDAGTREGQGGQTLLKGTDKILIMLKSIP